MKHQRTFLVGLSVLVAAAITATVLAVIWNGLWQRERQASEHAKFFLIQANKTVERFSSLLDDRRVDDLPTSIRQRVLKESIAYYEDFVRFTSSQPELNHQKGVALAKLARLRELGGDYRGAEQAYRMAVEELATVAAVTTDPSVRFDHAKTLNWLGLLLKRRGRLDEAESITQNAIRELEPLQGLPSAQPKWLATQAMATANMAELMSAKGMTDAARQQYELALELLEKSQASKLADFDLQSAYHKIEGNYLTLLMELDPDRAENRLIETIENLEAVNQLINDPDEKQPLSGQELAAEELRQENRDFIADLRNNLAVLLCQRNRPEQGFVEAQLAINYWREQFEKGERYFKAAEHYATALNTAGEACWLLASNENLEEVEKEKKLVDADNFFQQAETLLVKALENEDHRPELKSRLASIRHNRGSLCASREDWETAKGHFQSAIELQRQARDQQPEHTTFQLRLEAHEQALEAIKKYFSEATNL